MVSAVDPRSSCRSRRQRHRSVLEAVLRQVDRRPVPGIDTPTGVRHRSSETRHPDARGSPATAPPEPETAQPLLLGAPYRPGARRSPPPPRQELLSVARDAGLAADDVSRTVGCVRHGPRGILGQILLPSLERANRRHIAHRDRPHFRPAWINPRGSHRELRRAGSDGSGTSQSTPRIPARSRVVIPSILAPLWIPDHRGSDTGGSCRSVSPASVAATITSVLTVRPGSQRGVHDSCPTYNADNGSTVTVPETSCMIQPPCRWSRGRRGPAVRASAARFQLK